LLDLGGGGSAAGISSQVHHDGRRCAPDGASFQLRVGAAPALASLRPAARAVGVGGVVHLRLTRPAHDRSVLIWFTSLPPGPSGTFQENVHGLQLQGR